jgi:hypothetical protein
MQEISTGVVATGAAVLTAETAIASAPYVAPLVEGTTAVRVGSAAGNLYAQGSKVDSIGEVNIMGPVAAAIFPNSGMAEATLSNFGEIRVSDITSGDPLANTIFGNKTILEAGTTTLYEGSANMLFNAAGGKAEGMGLGGDMTSEMFREFSASALSGNTTQIGTLLNQSYERPTSNNK